MKGSISHMVTVAAVATTLVALLVAGVFGPGWLRGDTPEAQSGVIDLHGWSFELDGALPLTGDWTLQWERLSAWPGVHEQAIAVPGNWNALVDPDARRSFATYGLTLVDLEPGHYGIFAPPTASANRIYVEGEVLAESGDPGVSADSTRTEWRSNDLYFETDGSPVRIAVQVAAFHHFQNGMPLPFSLGTAQQVQGLRAVSLGLDAFIIGAVLLIGAYQGAIWAFRRHDRVPLIFAAFCVSFALHELIMGSLIYFLWPGAPWPVVGKLLLFNGLLMAGLFIAYAEGLFSAYLPRVFVYFTVAFLGVCAVFDLFSDVYRASLTVPWYNVFLVLASVFVLTRVLLALRDGVDGAGIFLVGLSLFFAGLIIDALMINGVIPYEFVLSRTGLLGIGLFCFLCAQALVLARRFARTFNEIERARRQEQQLLQISNELCAELNLEALLRNIMRACTELLEAQRSSLYLHDRNSGELFTRVAEGVEDQEIRIASDAGLAGAAFTSGAPVVVDDAYEDERFLGRVDATTGFKTRSVLAVPIVNREGRRLGVTQVLNKNDGSAFTSEDVEKLSALTAQAAVAIDNASLFDEVVTTRNFNESVLQSLQSGVVALDQNGQITKINSAAARIFGVEEASALSLRMADALQTRIGWIDRVLAAEVVEPTEATLRDQDVALVNGRRFAANITFAPLVDQEHARTGSLFVVDDITQDKRVRDTMARYMSQEVADQLMEEGADQLGGTTQQVTVLFSDIRGFTSMSEALGARGTVAMLNEYFEAMIEVILRHGGILDKYIGDAIMALFGAPFERPNDADSGLRVANEMLAALRPINAAREATGQGRLEIGIGLSTGPVILGNIGSPKRMEYTVIGSSVNRASRIESLTKFYGAQILVDEPTVRQAGDDHWVRFVDRIRVKGQQAPVSVFEALDHRREESGLGALVDLTDEAARLFYAGDFGAATEAFEQAGAQNPDDPMTRIYLERCADFIANPPGDDWDGVYTHLEK